MNDIARQLKALPDAIAARFRSVIDETEIDLSGIVASAWAGDKGWGVSKNNWPAVGVAGVQLPQPVTLAEFVGVGPPKLYEVRLSAIWGDALAGVYPRGLLQADILYGAGSGSHNVTIDVNRGSSIIVPGGTITVNIKQVGPFARALVGVAASISIAGGKGGNPTCSFLPDPIAIVGPPALQQYSARVPTRARAVRITGRYDLGVMTLVVNQGGTGILTADTGTDRQLLQLGLPLPACCDSVVVTRPTVVGVDPIITFLLD